LLAGAPVWAGERSRPDGQPANFGKARAVRLGQLSLVGGGGLVRRSWQTWPM